MPSQAWPVEVVGGVTVVRCAALSELPGVGHAFSTRRGPQDRDFDLRAHADGEPAFARRLEALGRAAGLAGQRPFAARQVHGTNVVRAGRRPGGRIPEADAVLALREDRLAAPAVRWADCVPVLLADRACRAVAAVHAGWRGVALDVAGHAVAALADCGIEPGALTAALGPAIGACCYEVGVEVAEAVTRASGGGDGILAGPGGRHLDLRGAIRLQLERAGLRPASIHATSLCTACAEDLFHSHRRDGASAGRQMACIGWTAAARP